MKQAVRTENAPAPVGPYSQAIKKGNMLFCSGQIAIDPSNNTVQNVSVKEQAVWVMKNIQNVLMAAGYDFDDVVKTTIFLTKMSDFATVNEVYAEYFREPFPARSTIAVSELPKGVQVEIEVTAIK